MLGAAFATGCGTRGPSSTNTPTQMFKAVILDRIPASVTQLQGVGDTWQGYSLYLRFTASDADMDAIIKQGYSPVDWERCSWRFELPDGYDRFNPPWRPAEIAAKACYRLSEVRNSWTHFGEHYLVIDRAVGLVYFYGVGS